MHCRRRLFSSSTRVFSASMFAATPVLFGGSEITPVETPIAPNQAVQKQWQLQDSKTPIRRMVLSVPGLTYVEPINSPKASQTVETTASSFIRVSSDSPDVLELIELCPLGSDGFELRLKPDAKIEHKHHLLTEVQLAHAHEVHSIECQGKASVVVAPGTIAVRDPTAELRVSLSGSGDVYVNETSAVHAASAALALYGSGDLHIAFPQLKTEQNVSVQVAASGDLTLLTPKLETNQLRAQLTGSGDLQVAAEELHVQSAELEVIGSGSLVTRAKGLQANAVSALVRGSGDLVLKADNMATQSFTGAVTGSGDLHVKGHQCRTTSSEVSVTGSGDLQAMDLVAMTANVNAVGSGDVSIQARKKLVARGVGSGSVTCANEPPIEVECSQKRSISYRSHESKVYAWKPTSLSSAPMKHAAFDKITINSTINGGGKVGEVIKTILSAFGI